MNTARSVTLIERLQRRTTLPSQALRRPPPPCRDADDRRREPDFLRGVGVQDRGADEWQDTVAAFATL